jgi:hypothetical protein
VLSVTNEHATVCQALWADGVTNRSHYSLEAEIHVSFREPVRMRQYLCPSVTRSGRRWNYS